jgi:hypothetical protein
MPEGHAIATFTQSRATPVPACRDSIKQGTLEEFAELGLLEAIGLMNVNSAG